MGLEIEVGVLADLRESDPKGYEHLRIQFGLLNIYLERIGMPRHDEPDHCEVWSCQMAGYSGLHYLRRIAAHMDLTGNLPPPGGEEAAYDGILQDYYTFAEKKRAGLPVPPGYKFGFDHLILHNDDDGFYLPIEFEAVLTPDPGLEIEGGRVGSAVRLLEECKRLAAALEIPPHIDENSDELSRAAGSQGEGAAKWQKYGMESFACVRLMKACRKSIETGAAVVFT